MSEVSMLFKLFLGLGLIFLLVGFLYPGQDAAWNAMAQQLQTGPALPTFVNPFDTPQSSIFVDTWYPSNRTWPNSNFASFGTKNGCSNTTYWNCIVDPNGTDNNDTYIEVTSSTVTGSPFINVTLGGVQAGRIRGIVANFWCRVVSSNMNQGVGIAVYLNQTQGNPPQDLPLWAQGGGICPFADWGQMSIAVRDIDVATNTAKPFTLGWNQYRSCVPCTPEVNGGFPSPGDLIDATVDYTTVNIQVTLAATSTPGCTGTDFFGNLGCQIGRLFDPITRIILYAINAIVFAVTWVVTIFLFIGTIIALMFIGLFSAVAFIFGPGTGAPLLVRGILIALFVAIFAAISYLVLKHLTALVGALEPL